MRWAEYVEEMLNEGNEEGNIEFERNHGNTEAKGEIFTMKTYKVMKK